MAFSYCPKIVTDGLVLYLDAGNPLSYPGSGTTWTDLSRGQNPGTLINGPTFDSGNAGSIVFDGVDDYVNITPITTPSEITLECFFYANSTASKVIIFGTTTLVYYTPRISLRGNVVNIYFGGGGGSGDVIFTFNSITTNQFYQLVYTYNTSDLHRCYLNGVAGTRTSNGTAINAIPQFTTLRLGVYPGGSDAAFNGTISIFRMYNKVLSASEILQNYNSTKGRFGL